MLSISLAHICCTKHIHATWDISKCTANTLTHFMAHFTNGKQWWHWDSSGASPIWWDFLYTPASDLVQMSVINFPLHMGRWHRVRSRQMADWDLSIGCWLHPGRSLKATDSEATGILIPLLRCYSQAITRPLMCLVMGLCWSSWIRKSKVNLYLCFVRASAKKPCCGAHGKQWRITVGCVTILYLALPSGLPFFGWLQVSDSGAAWTKK